MNPVVKWTMCAVIALGALCCVGIEPIALFVALDGSGAPVPGAAIYALIIAATPLVLAGAFVWTLTHFDKHTWLPVAAAVLSLVVTAEVAWQWVRMEGWDLPTSPPALAAGHDFRYAKEGPHLNEEWTSVLQGAFPVGLRENELIARLKSEHFGFAQQSPGGSASYIWRDGKCRYMLSASWLYDSKHRLKSVMGFVSPCMR